MRELILHLPNKLYEELQHKAEKGSLTVEELAVTIIDDNLELPDEPSDQEIAQAIRDGIQDAANGLTVPADKVYEAFNPSKEQILTSIRDGMNDAQSGRVDDARDMIQRLQKEFGADDASR